MLKGQYTDEHGRVQDVAIKRLKQNMYEKFAAEFEKEFVIMIQLQHPNIVRIIGQSVERMSPTTTMAILRPLDFVWDYPGEPVPER